MNYPNILTHSAFGSSQIFFACFTQLHSIDTTVSLLKLTLTFQGTQFYSTFAEMSNSGTWKDFWYKLFGSSEDSVS